MNSQFESILFDLNCYFQNSHNVFVILTHNIENQIKISGDCACQMLSTYVSGEKSEPYDFLRTLRFATMGSFFIAPSLHIWYGKLSQVKHDYDDPISPKMNIKSSTLR